MIPPLPSPEELRRRLREPVDGASLAVLRISFGVVMAFDALTYLTSGRIERYWLLSGVRFPYEWLT
jgi:hypothetical protein